MSDNYSLRYVGNRNAATGKAEAVAVRVYPDGSVESIDGNSVDQTAPTFSEQVEAVEWARKTFVTN